tara:strand:+ start:478 stop:1743 length:1266 start_codon:yes stop_codon:yes gene_type:complete
MVFFGFSAGLPYLLVFSTLTAWLTEEGVSRSAIGLFAWVGMTYSVKIIWAPIVDRAAIPFFGRVLGQRRSWILFGQMLVVFGLIAISIFGVSNLPLLALFSVIVAFGSSTQDIAIDAYRIEAIEEEYQGAMSASYILGYRIALLIAGAGAFYVASFTAWSNVYLVMAVLMGVGFGAVMLAKEPLSSRQGLIRETDSAFNVQKFTFLNAVVNPFKDFFVRNGSFALLIILLIGVYRLSDIVMGIMANPFYLDMGYSKIEIANITKVFGFFMTIFGAFVGGLLVIKWGVGRCLLIGAVAVATTNLFFAQLALLADPDLNWLAVTVSLDNLSGGFATTAFIAYLSGLTNKAYTATQYALFSSLMTLPGKFMSGFSGFVVDSYGYFTFFLSAAALGLPAILLIWFYFKNQKNTNSELSSDGSCGN